MTTGIKLFSQPSLVCQTCSGFPSEYAPLLPPDYSLWSKEICDGWTALVVPPPVPDPMSLGWLDGATFESLVDYLSLGSCRRICIQRERGVTVMVDAVEPSECLA